MVFLYGLIWESLKKYRYIMIGNRFNMDNVFLRDLTVCVLDTLEGKISWINRFTSGDKSVNVPFYYSLTGDERYLLDSFQDDIASDSRPTEFNTDIIPRGHLTLTSFNIKSDEFRNPNVWLRQVVETNTEVKKLLSQVRAIPITANYDLSILLKTEVDIFKCAQSLMNTLWLYKFMYFEYNYMHIDAIMAIPDGNQVEFVREKNISSDNQIKLTLAFEVQTYYPAFAQGGILANDGTVQVGSFGGTSTTGDPGGTSPGAPGSIGTPGSHGDQFMEPSRTRWFNNILMSRSSSSMRPLNSSGSSSSTN